jgi:Tol biopolymer transport system component
VAEADAASVDPSLSGDGRFVAFASEASNVVFGDSNGTGDVFVRDRATDRSARVSVSSAGVQGDAGSFAPIDLGRWALCGLCL